MKSLPAKTLEVIQISSAREFCFKIPFALRFRLVQELFFARSQMGMSLAFHIVFAVAGIGMPVLMVMAERAWQRSGDPAALELAKRWARGAEKFTEVVGMTPTQYRTREHDAVRAMPDCIAKQRTRPVRSRG